MGTDDGMVKFLDAQCGKVVGAFQLDGNVSVTCLALSPDGRCVLVCGSDGRARLVDVDTNTVLDTQYHGACAIRACGVTRNNT